MIRGSGLRGSKLREDEDVQPMQYVANLTDVMGSSASTDFGSLLA